MRRLLLSRSVARLSRCSSTLQPNSPVSRCLCSASQPLSGEMLHSRRHLHHLSRSHMRLFSKKTKDMWWFTEGVSDNCPTVDVHPATILEGSSHRDGSIYKFCPGFIQVFQIADRHEIVFGEACLEPMMLSQPMDCQPNRDTCTVHFSTRMMQIFSIKLAKIHMYSGPVQIYRYIAVRDHLDSMLNYVVNRSRDDPIIVKQVLPSP
uniref:DUF6598 domain-containing protein n=1 Tax=Oryza nivara TaxID=4536 RepID=A0A0E0IH43_ORYNI